MIGKIQGGFTMLTERQEEILKAIHKYIQVNGISPTIRNICDLVGLKSSSTVHGYLKVLRDWMYYRKILGLGSRYFYLLVL